MADDDDFCRVPPSAIASAVGRRSPSRDGVERRIAPRDTRVPALPLQPPAEVRPRCRSAVARGRCAIHADTITANEPFSAACHVSADPTHRWKSCAQSTGSKS
jgi:hypothetical protein